MIWFAVLVVAAMPHTHELASVPKGEQPWSPKKAPLMTRWAKDVAPEKTHPDYPRPQMRRSDWMSLNGLWDLEIRRVEGPDENKSDEPGPPDPTNPVGLRASPASKRAERVRWKGKVLVPFPVESALSGVMERVEPSDTLVYRRGFQVPRAWKRKRVMLHFGAVDWQATVLVNGREVGTHRGGYDPFSFDITDCLWPDVSNERAGAQSSAKQGEDPRHELVVRVWDHTDAGAQPRGKQVLKPEGIWYTPSSGIWQTVWLEPVPALSIARLRIQADAQGVAKFDIVAHVAPNAPRPRSEFSIELTDGKRILKAEGVIGKGAIIKVADPKLWSPDSPHLYPIRVRWAGDEVRSYAGFRTISLGKEGQGPTRIFLNGKPYFLVGLLDQGFWPDGLYTPPTDAALRYDLEVTKRLGFNFIRKHVKVETARFYYWCDKMGILVFQDMPSGDRYIGGRDPDITRTKESGEQFERELTAMIEGLRNHPCVAGWVPYNEGWGQWDTARITYLVKRLDPSRLVVSASGWTDRGTGDLVDWHAYPGPAAPKPEERRASFLGEFGGLGLPVEGHTWQKEGWGYRTFDSLDHYRQALDALFRDLRFLIADPGLSGAVYTQTTDVETELNGLLTYDREVLKPDAARLAKSVKALFLPPPRVVPIVPTSENAPQHWSYRTGGSEVSLRGFEQPGYDDSQWERGPGGFGTRGTPGAIVRTIWNTPEIWLRRVVDVPHPQPATGASKWRSPHLRVHHDEDAVVYLDGKLIARLQGYTTGYVLIPLDPALLHPGKRVLAAHCRQTVGGQYIDLGIVDVVEQRGKPARHGESPAYKDYP